jgi:hypothetical protein
LVLRGSSQLRIAAIDLVLDDQEEENGDGQREREGEFGGNGQRRFRPDDQPDVADRAGDDAAEEVEWPEGPGGWSRPVGGRADRTRLRNRLECDTARRTG